MYSSPFVSDRVVTKSERMIAIVCVAVVYGASFLLPVKMAEQICGDKEPIGAQVLLKAIEMLFDERGFAWSAFGAMLPNLLVWLGLFLIWWRLPYLSFLTGLFATALAAGWILWASGFGIDHKPDASLAHNLGAYSWLASMVALAIAGFWLSSTQQRRHHSPTMSYPEICKAVEQATPQSP